MPFDITAYDLREILIKTRAKTCFIPRTRNKYTRARYAYVTFETEEIMTETAAGEGQFKIKDQ